jgi:hypothetical protein
MELQKFINENDDWITKMKSKGLKIRKYNKYNSILVSHYYDKPLDYTNDEDYWIMYCKGAVINININKVICIPPVKSKEIDLESDKFKKNTYQHLIDGTMINLFNINDEWIISTRSEIGGYNKWKGKKSFRKMFDECINFDINLLNKDYCYSFVMKHLDNINISNVYSNEVYLVEIYDINTLTLVHENLPENIQKITNIIYENDKVHKLNFNNFKFKGITVREGNKRYKYINPEYTEVSELVQRTNNSFIDYLELRKNNNLKKYLSYYPEKNKLFEDYRNQFHQLTNELYSKYKNTFVVKIENKNTIPYHLKPFIKEIHQIYKSTGVPLSFKTVKDYMHNLPSKRIIFAIQNKK